jgi:predicted thioesterase
VDVEGATTIVLEADFEVVWSWPPGAEVKVVTTLSRCTGDRGKTAGPWGEHV